MHALTLSDKETRFKTCNKW